MVPAVITPVVAPAVALWPLVPLWPAAVVPPSAATAVWIPPESCAGAVRSAELPGGAATSVRPTLPGCSAVPPQAASKPSTSTAARLTPTSFLIIFSLHLLCRVDRQQHIGAVHAAIFMPAGSPA